MSLECMRRAIPSALSQVCQYRDTAGIQILHPECTFIVPLFHAGKCNASGSLQLLFAACGIITVITMRFIDYIAALRSLRAPLQEQACYSPSIKGKGVIAAPIIALSCREIVVSRTRYSKKRIANEVNVFCHIRLFCHY